jgi:anthranilate/para-aminobenzoate synthase component II
MVFVLDNYDSFTYKLVQYLGELGAKVEVYPKRRAEAMKPERILLSPGSCTPGAFLLAEYHGGSPGAMR